MYLTKQIGSNAANTSFSNEVLKPLEMNNIMIIKFKIYLEVNYRSSHL